MKLILGGGEIRITKKLLLIIVLIMICMTGSCANRAAPTNTLIREYSNPIDAYFLPRIENAADEAERRETQDTYKGVWKTEFENILLWMQDKYIYQEDRDNLLIFAESVESLVEKSRTVFVTDLLEDYSFSPDSPERNHWGNGTRSALNQKEAEIYRDAAMKIADDTYVFLERDYSLAHFD